MEDKNNYDETNVEEETTQTQEDNTEEETQEEETQTEDKTEETNEEESSDDDQEDVEALKERLRKAEKAIAKAKKKSKESSKKENNSSSENERLDRLELKYAGIKEPDDQDLVLEYVRLRDISIDEAVNSRLIQAEIKENERKRTSEQASPRGNNRTPGAQDDLSSAYRKYKKDGSIPDDIPLRNKLLKKLSSE